MLILKVQLNNRDSSIHQHNNPTTNSNMIKTITKAVAIYLLSLPVTTIPAQAQTFEPPEPRVSAKYITQTPAYLIICDNGARRIVTKEKFDQIRIGDICPPKNPQRNVK